MDTVSECAAFRSTSWEVWLSLLAMRTLSVVDPSPTLTSPLSVGLTFLWLSVAVLIRTPSQYGSTTRLVV